MDKKFFKRKIWKPVIKTLEQIESESDHTLLSGVAKRLEQEFGEYLKGTYDLLAEVVTQCEQLDFPTLSREALADITVLKSCSRSNSEYLLLLEKVIRIHCTRYKEYQELCGTSYNGFAQRLLEYLNRLRKRTGGNDVPFNVFASWFAQAEAMVKGQKRGMLHFWDYLLWLEALGAYSLEKAWIEANADLATEIETTIKLFRTISDSFQLSSILPPTGGIPMCYSQYNIDFRVLEKALEESVDHPRSRKELEDSLRKLSEGDSEGETDKIFKIKTSDLTVSLEKRDWFYEHELNESRKCYRGFPFRDELELFFEVKRRFYSRVADVSTLGSLLDPVWRVLSFYIDRLQTNRTLAEKVIFELIKSFDFEMLAGIGLRAYKRFRYSFSRKEIVAILFTLLGVKKGERLLDMFGNIPRISLGASILGASIVTGDVEYQFFEDFATFRAAIVRKLADKYWAIHSRQAWKQKFEKELEQLQTGVLVHLLQRERIGSELLPDAGGFPLSFDRVNPVNLFVFSHNFFVKFAQQNLDVVKYALPWEEGQNIGLPFQEGVFDKIIVDPPYGIETAHEGFGPSKALFIAKTALEEANRLVRTGGSIAISLPPERWEGKWLAIAKLGWRDELFVLADNKLGLEFVIAYEQGRGIIKTKNELNIGERGLVVYRKTEKQIRLTHERQNHFESEHPEMSRQIEKIKGGEILWEKK